MSKKKTLCVMIDMSRNAVMNLPRLKDFIKTMKSFGYNSIMLYTEDTYEVEGEPYFGYMRGRYSIAELREIDDYAYNLGMEVIPCIQTLAHLNAFLKWRKVPIDIDDILLVDDDRTYQFIDNVFKSLTKCFRSKRIHIGMDEAANVGRGCFLNKHGYERAIDIIKRHLGKVLEIAKKYDYEPMIWSDMLFRSWNNGNYYIPKTEIPENVKNSLPDGVAAVYWDYYNGIEEKYDEQFYNHLQITKNLWFAGGVWCWTGITPQNRFSIDAMLPAIRSCKKHKINNIIMTLWGDDGGECSHYTQLPALFYLAEYMRGNTDENSIKLKFKRKTGLDFDSFMALDLPNQIAEKMGTRNPAKYMLYSDLFNGFLDYTVSEGVEKMYSEYSARLADIAKASRKWRYIFDTEAKLCSVLSYKYELGVKTRAAYKNGDKTALKALIDNYYTPLIPALKSFYTAFKKQWYTDNKASGFDVQEIRIGGLILRVTSQRERLLDYVAGKIDRIEELECDILPFGNGAPGEPIFLNGYKNYASPNVISH